MTEACSNHKAAVSLGYLVCILTVPVYASLFSLWQRLRSVEEPELLDAAPIIVTGLVVLILLLLLRRKKMVPAQSTKRLSALLGMAVCCAALVIPDPAFPIKRIHVLEYMLLALLVRYTMSFRLTGWPLLFFSACFASLLGIHDEFIQGLHPQRTFGLRDMLVNGFGSWGGALIWHGFGLFDRPAAAFPVQDKRFSVGAVFISWLILSIVAFVWPMAAYRTMQLPFWPAWPLAGAVVFYVFYKNSFQHRLSHGIGALLAAASALILYPAVNRILDLPFF